MLHAEDSVGLQGLVEALAVDPALAEALRAARSGDRPELGLTGPAAAQPLVTAALASDAPMGAGRTVLAVTATGREAEDLAGAVADLVGEDRVALFPAWETLPHERLSPRADTVGARLAVARRLAHPHDARGGLAVVVAPVRALLQPMVAGLGDLEPVTARAGAEVGLDAMVDALAGAGYVRVDLVEHRGEFAVRGGLVDVFPPTEEHPLRVEFVGDTVEEVRAFQVGDQRSLGQVDGLWAPPCRELTLTPEVRAAAAEQALAYPGLAAEFEALAAGMAVEGMESLAPVLVGPMQLLPQLLPDDAIVLVCDPVRLARRAGDLVATSEEFLASSWAAAAAGGATPLDLRAAAYRGLDEVAGVTVASGRSWWQLGVFGAGGAEPEDEDRTDGTDGADSGRPAGGDRLDAVAAPRYRGDTDRAMREVATWVRQGWRVVLVTAGHGPAQRLLERLGDAGLPAAAGSPAEVGPGVVAVTTGALQAGLLSPALRLAVLTEADLLGQRGTTRQERRLPSRRRHQVDVPNLVPGDFVVHEAHGIGRYVELTQRTVAGATREYLVVEYAASKRGHPGDRLYVPSDQLDQLTRYVGGEAPTVHRLGGADWAKTKGRARKAVREIAAELIRLYSARLAAPGHAFGPDTPWQRELEDAFPYTETPDQLSAIEDVKADMERAVPMDRLICGDVGYGKTEISVRAAFKAVQDGRQVALLVPTTLLAQQHLATFRERFGPFPVRVEGLSRFQTDAEAAAVVAGLADGSVDLVIGTHRLLTPEVVFRDLGLVIVDEEQRFGVEHKEYLKRLRASVDVLAMSATPIPRTLEMAVSGIREMSVIQTPPEERHPVLTFVGVYDERQIAAAVRRELLRDGQVFYVHNRVESIDRAAARLRERVPEARIAVAHGQMPEHALEQVIVDFWEKAFDVLVCTTIVESGLDIPNANTLIIERADTLGLSQLHQLRGRVGRARERGYAYFLYPAERPMTETAHDRLATIATHTDLGSGMAVAMKDLEIRGAGNLLGGEQSGHIAGVGFDLYVRMVGEAVAEYKSGGVAVEHTPARIELPVDAHLPHAYVPGERLRLEAYRRIAEAPSEAALDEVAAELADRYGPLPDPVATLLQVGRLRLAAERAGLTELTMAGTSVRASPVELPESGQLRLARLYPRTVVKESVRTILVPRPTTAPVGGVPLRDTALLDWALELVGVLTPVSAEVREAAG